MNNIKTAREIRKTYPKHSAAALSIALRPKETGVQLTPKAKAIYTSLNGTECDLTKDTECREKSARFSARLTEEAAEAVRAKMAEDGFKTVQELVEMLLMRWLET